MNSAIFFKRHSFTMNYTPRFFSKTLVFTMNDAIYFPKYQFLKWNLHLLYLFGTGWGQWRSEAEPSRAGPSRAEPSRAGPGRAEPRRGEPSHAKPSRAEPSRSEPTPCRAETSRAEPSRAEPGRILCRDGRILCHGGFKIQEAFQMVPKCLPNASNMQLFCRPSFKPLC